MKIPFDNSQFDGDDFSEDEEHRAIRRRLFETHWDLTLAEQEQAEHKVALYQGIRDAHANGWNEEEIAFHCNVPIGRVRAAIAEKEGQ